MKHRCTPDLSDVTTACINRGNAEQLDLPSTGDFDVLLTDVSHDLVTVSHGLSSGCWPSNLSPAMRYS